MNWSQISKKIPLLFVIMSHREWDGGEDGIGEKDGGLLLLQLKGRFLSLVLHSANLISLCWLLPFTCRVALVPR